MNKFKVLYDVARVMKSKEVFSGTLTVEVQKDDTQVFSLRNDFLKNLLTGQTKAKINTDLAYDGKTMKHESNTELTRPHCGEDGPHGFFRHHHHCHGGGGLQGKLARLAFGFSVLAALQVEEQANKAVVISLSAADLPEDSQALLREKMRQAAACRHHGHGFLQEFCLADSHDFVANLFVSPDHEVEKVVVTFVGTQKDAESGSHDLTARAELSFAW